MVWVANELRFSGRLTSLRGTRLGSTRAGTGLAGGGELRVGDGVDRVKLSRVDRVAGAGALGVGVADGVLHTE